MGFAFWIWDERINNGSTAVINYRLIIAFTMLANPFMIPIWHGTIKAMAVLIDCLTRIQRHGYVIEISCLQLLLARLLNFYWAFGEGCCYGPWALVRIKARLIKTLRHTHDLTRARYPRIHCSIATMWQHSLILCLPIFEEYSPFQQMDNVVFETFTNWSYHSNNILEHRQQLQRWIQRFRCCQAIQ